MATTATSRWSGSTCSTCRWCTTWRPATTSTASRQTVKPERGDKRLRPRRHGADGRLRAHRQALPDAALPLGRGARRAAGTGREPARAAKRADHLHQPRDRRRRAEHPRLLRADAAAGPEPAAAGALAGDGVPPDRRRGRGADRRPALHARRGRHLLRTGLHRGDAEQPFGECAVPSSSSPTNRRCTGSWACTRTAADPNHSRT